MKSHVWISDHEMKRTSKLKIMKISVPPSPWVTPGEDHKYLDKERTSAQVWVEECGWGKMTSLATWTCWGQLPVFMYATS